ncbi:MAG: hypothetical protein WDW36_002292 [Sanguina aurantia]
MISRPTWLITSAVPRRGRVDRAVAVLHARAPFDNPLDPHTVDAGSGSSRDGRLQCGSRITALAWDLRADKVMLVGTESSGIRVWHVDTQRIITDVPADSASPYQHPHASQAAPLPLPPPHPSSVHSPGRGCNSLPSLGRGRLSSWNMRAFKKVASYSLPEHQEGAATSLALHPHGAWFAATVASPDGLLSRPMLHMFDVGGRGSLIRSIPLGSTPTSPASSHSTPDSGSGSTTFGPTLRMPPAVTLCELSGETCMATAVSCDSPASVDLGGNGTGSSSSSSSGGAGTGGGGSSTLLQLWSLRKPNVPLSQLLLPPLQGDLLQGRGGILSHRRLTTSSSRQIVTGPRIVLADVIPQQQ